VLAGFDSVAKATRCAAGLRDAVAPMNQSLPGGRTIAIRSAINLGDVVVDEGDMFGDVVNVAAQVEAPGSIYVSEAVRNQVAEWVSARGRSPLPTVSQGSQAVRGCF
jgi:class 3 adenylate cyclase